MAEIAIPLALLGGLYIVANKDDTNTQPSSSSNTKKQITQENFTSNRVIPKSNQRTLENTHTPDLNYPTSNTKEYKTDIQSQPSYYPSPNNHNDVFYNREKYEKKYENLESFSNAKNSQITSLTGKQVDSNQFTHNNMVPFFGSKVTQNVDVNNDNRLDNMIGSGSLYMSKQEQAPLFKPQKNMQWGHGMPSTSDFMQSRMNPSKSMNNVKPFQEIRVGPSLTNKDGIGGSGGFNSGMEARDQWRPKTVDELRVASNPKVTYGGVTLGGKDRVTNRGILGKVEKYTPDSFFIHSPDRYFTTTGIEKAQTARSKELLKYENRADTTTEYFGASELADAQGPYLQVPDSYRPSRRPELAPNTKHITNTYANNRNKATTGDYGIKGYKSSVLPNNRDLTHARSGNQFGIVGSFLQAVTAPLMDVLRPSRKENVIGNSRPNGNVGVVDHEAGYVYNPNDRAKTTIREMTENRPDHYYLNNQKESGGYGYIVNKNRPVAQERDDTCVEYVGNVNAQDQIGAGGYEVSNQVAYGQARDGTNVSYIGNAGNTNTTSNAQVYDSAYNAHLINKEPLSRGRVPMGNSTKIFNGQEFTNMKVDKLECDRRNNRMFVPQQIGYSQNAHTNQLGQITRRSEFGQDIHQQRMNPVDLQAFRNNPYTKPLNSVA